MVVLLADDDASIRRVFARALEAMGHRVETVADGAALLRRAAESRPDAVLSDIGLPECDGIRACRSLRAALPDLRVVLMTGDRSLAAEARRLGFSAVLLKPFPLEELRGAFPAF